MNGNENRCTAHVAAMSSCCTLQSLLEAKSIHSLVDVGLLDLVGPDVNEYVLNIVLKAWQGDMEREVDSYLRRKYENAFRDVEIVEREDLDLKNHLSGLKRRLLKVCAHHHISQKMYSCINDRDAMVH